MPSFLSLHTFIFSLISFGLSGVLTLLLTQNLGVAVLIGILTAVLSAVNSLVGIKKYRQHEKFLRNSLRSQIQQLESEENQLYQSLYETRSTQEQLEASITALNKECRQLIDRVAELHQQRNNLYQDTLTLQQQKERHESTFQQLQNQAKLIEQSKTEVKHSLEITKTQFQQLKSQVNTLQIDAERLQLQITNRKEQYETLEAEIDKLTQEKQSQETAIAQLQQDIDNLLQQRSQINSDRPTHPTLENGDRAVEINLDDIISISMALPPEWKEWLQFAQQLKAEDRLTFNAILERDAATLKKLADERATMPQVLVESLNENALEVIGDTLFVPTDNKLLPQVHEEYAHLLLNAIELKFKDFLKLQENRE
ncbi:MAG: hypothetical protein SAJ12_12180 [Jaaginema sp. PMC 1079.18]|nr:hypothetical protein [Jaaginema sp. PMC 1080.18]MEC4851763.1 hypothetical protein [Jaaginema sp. PMC 1079.18]MEC4867242.1 hypothetical protein [Jaaginema sp. PMC 1078.18]